MYTQFHLFTNLSALKPQMHECGYLYVNIRIEIQIFSLHWMMQNISILMSPRSPSGFTDIKKPNVLHHSMQAKNLHFNP